MAKTKLTKCWHPDDGRIYLCLICNKGGWRSRAKMTLRDHLMVVVFLLVLALVLAGGIWAASATGRDVCLGYDPGESCS
jgi:hypothetical protein